MRKKHKLFIAVVTTTNGVKPAQPHEPIFLSPALPVKALATVITQMQVRNIEFVCSFFFEQRLQSPRQRLLSQQPFTRHAALLHGIPQFNIMESWMNIWSSARSRLVKFGLSPANKLPPRVRSLPQGVVYLESSSNKSRTFQLLLI